MFSSPDISPMNRPKRSLASNVSAVASCTEQLQEAIEEAVVLDEIARHHRIRHGSSEQLLDKAMPHGMRPVRFARSSQGFSEAFRHDAGSHRLFNHQEWLTTPSRSALKAGMRLVVAFVVVDGPHVPADVTGIEMMRELSR